MVPQHLEEGQEITLAQPELELALGQPVTFPLYTSTVRGAQQAGSLTQTAQLLQLPPLHTILRGGKRSGTHRYITLAARCTEIGTLELYCVSRDANNRWRWNSTSATSSKILRTRVMTARVPKTC